MGITLNQLVNSINKVKQYSDKKFPVVSPDESNAIIKNENGIFVEDKQPQIDELKEKINPIAKYQKYVNTELDYCHANANYANSLNYTSTFNIQFQTCNTNMDIDEEKQFITLKANKQYNVQYTSRIGSSGECQAGICILTEDGEEICLGVDSTGVYDKTWDGKCINTIISFEKDTKICIQYYMIQNTITSVQADLSIIEINRQITIDPLEHVNSSQGIEDTPVGHIISHMGTIAPKHYLICDGTEYNIIDYPYLAQHFKDSFGSINYFGGDGTETFAVPDLRGEFLRGTGTGIRNSGSGGEVGEHQDGTSHPYVWSGSSIGCGKSNLSPSNMDLVNSINTKHLIANATAASERQQAISYTSRPTNTSVLYCIKYEPTYYMQVQNTNYLQPSLYSEEEQIIGSWINGKPIYEKTFINCGPLPNNSNRTIETGIEIDNLININGAIKKDNLFLQIPYPHIAPVIMHIKDNNIYIATTADYSVYTIVYITIQYTKTTDEENSFTKDMLNYIPQNNNSLTDEELQQAISDIVEEIKKEEVVVVQDDTETQEQVEQINENLEDSIDNSDEPIDEEQTLEPEKEGGAE